MKQGRASRDVREGWMRSPTSASTNVKGVSQIGQAMGNKATDHSRLINPIEPIHSGRGFQAPQPKSREYNKGSQGRY